MNLGLDMQKIKYSRDSIITDLRENPCEIFFRNVDGNRVGVRCSLRPDLLPESYSLTEESKEREFHEKNPSIISAWDLNNHKWRQFHIDVIEYVQSVDTY
jgi:WYL_2, Sm-like SH3 beta-barrel fold